jgi:Protein of unknown function (DUF3489)
MVLPDKETIIMTNLNTKPAAVSAAKLNAKVALNASAGTMKPSPATSKAQYNELESSEKQACDAMPLVETVEVIADSSPTTSLPQEDGVHAEGANKCDSAAYESIEVEASVTEVVMPPKSANVSGDAELAKPKVSRATTTKALPTAAQPTKASKKVPKSALVQKLLSRARGATLAEIEEATGWQAHSVRAFLSGLRKKGLDLVRETRKDGASAYRISA